jgi:hypothetical protein
MRKPSYLVSVAVLLVAVTPAIAEFTVMGLGIQTCGQFAKLYRTAPSETETIYFTWAQGFLSGLNSNEIAATGNNQDLNSIPVDQQERDIREYCNTHPLAAYMDAVLDLYTKFSPGTAIPKMPH